MPSPSEVVQSWERWKNELDKLKGPFIRRHHHELSSDVSHVELHVFVLHLTLDLPLLLIYALLIILIKSKSAMFVACLSLLVCRI